MTRRNVLSFWNSTDGPVIRWKCTCGHEGFLDRNGTSTDPRPSTVPAGSAVHA